MKTVFITGATSGIGREFAKFFASKGCRLILTGRRTDRLVSIREKAGENCRIITADLSDEKGCRQLLKDIDNEDIDIFINNAGFGTAGTFLETDLDKEVSMIRVNDIAMHILFKGVIMKMQKKGKGTILNVASSAGLLPAGPYMATYYASKAYVVSLTKAVAQELKEKGSSIYVCCLCPGPVDTEFNSKSDVVFALKGIAPKTCVIECLAGMKKRKVVIVPTLRMKLAVTFQHLLPESMLIRLVGHQQKKKIP
ncbi:SDR family NAD(P)-dependent oxidoreductase [Butyrivibrio sp. JL13D10]|uniref:SDR family NAD(P)-dependent oxidoreductase n=1 Tax=Butyrivibrio sp. JL13D10 TaxID=3236815 RepID=UPI0038B4835D